LAAEFPTKELSVLKKPFSRTREVRRQRLAGTMAAWVKITGSVMSAFFTLIYQEYCRARLAEMLKAGLAT